MSCPICEKKTHKDHAPFCSDRCRMVDLNHWLKGSYSVPVVEDDDLPDDISDLENGEDNLHH